MFSVCNSCSLFGGSYERGGISFVIQQREGFGSPALHRNIMEKVKNYVLNQLDEMTFWLGVIGVFVWLFLPKSWLLLFFLVLIFLPDLQFSKIIAKGKKGVLDALGENDNV